MSGSETLALKYIKLSPDLIDPDNPKEHDIGAIIQSFTKYGFQEVPKFNGDFIVAGNGRVEALIRMRDAGQPPPLGIGVKGKDWYVPVIVGNELDQQLAKEYLIDANNLTLMGGEFSALDASRMWNLDGYLKVLETAKPITVDQEDVELLKRIAEFNVEYNAPPEEPPKERTQEIFSYRVVFDAEEDFRYFMKLLKEKASNPGLTLIEALELL